MRKGFFVATIDKGREPAEIKSSLTPCQLFGYKLLPLTWPGWFYLTSGLIAKIL
jgi:hypothetical protein